MGNDTRTVIQQPKETGLDEFAIGQPEGGAVHHVGHPQLVGQGALEGLGGAALRGRIMFDGTGVQLVGGQQPVYRGQAEGARLEDAFLDKLAHHHLDLELRILLTQFHDGLAGLGTERLASALVGTWLTL